MDTPIEILRPAYADPERFFRRFAARLRMASESADVSVREDAVHQALRELSCVHPVWVQFDGSQWASATMSLTEPGGCYCQRCGIEAKRFAQLDQD